MRILLLILLSLATASAQPKADPKRVAAKAAADDLVAGQLAKLFARFNEQQQKVLPEATLKARIEPGLKQLGSFKKYLSEGRAEAVGALDMFIYPAEFENGAVDISVAIDTDGKVSSFNVRPMRPIPMVSPVKEEQVVVKTDTFEMPGTLSWPKGDGPFPAVVIVHGSGPADRDLTMGPNTPYRDLAWGLAQQGVAVLRYDKRTKKYGRQSYGEKITLKQEVTEDALNAVALLRGTAKIDPARIVILGHSLGGQLAPQMAKEDGKLAGIVILAGPTRPASTLAAEQTKYIMTLNPGVKALETQLAEVEKLKNITAESAEKNVLGAPGYYWQEVDSALALPVAKKLTLPIMVLQGERDYQVTMEDFANWKAGIGGQDKVVLKSYPNLNHLFLEGEGKSKPAEYMRPGHVPDYVTNDISQWVKNLIAQKI